MPEEAKPPETPTKDNEPSIETYIPGAKDKYGNVIKSVIGSHRHVVVYITEKDRVGWRYHDLPERLRPAVAEFQILTGLASSSLSRKLLLRASMLLAQALYSALLSTENSDPIGHFAQARTFIHKKSTQRTRLLYALLTTVCGVVAIGVAFFFYAWLPNHEDLRRCLFVGVAGGITGALVSIMQRMGTLDVDPMDSSLFLTSNGMTRVGLGACFGFLFVAAVEANIVLGHFAHDMWALFALSAGAGFNERWIPELLGPHRE